MIKLDPNSGEACSLSLTSQLYQPILNLRNGPKYQTNADGSVVIGLRGRVNYEMGCLEMFGRRVAGELCFAALTVAAIIEHLVRMGLAVICFLPAVVVDLICCDYDFTRTGFVVMIGFASAVMLPDHTIRNVTALVTNIYSNRIKLEHLQWCKVL
jgi:hypothetical protein